MKIPPRCAAFSALLLLSVLPTFAQEAASRPTTRPATAAEKAAAIAYASAPADQPAVKRAFLGWHGETLENFGAPEPRFMEMHARFLERAKSPVGALFLGDSITEGWNNSPAIWNAAFGQYQPANFGIGGDNTSHVLWRIANGELDTVRPKVVVVMIGTNNILFHDAAEIARGTTAVVHAVHEKLPDAKILLLGIFPRMEKPDDPWRLKLKEVNVQLAKLADDHIRYMEIWHEFLAADGTLSRDVMPDFLHPNAKGYQIWADTMGPVLAEMMK